MSKMEYPLKFQFKIGTFSNDFVAKDANGNTTAYVSQKMFKLKEQIVVYSDESKSKEIFKIDANKWLDFNTAYNFTSSDGVELGKVARKGWRSLFKAKYELYDENDKQDLVIQEENAWVKVVDSLFGEIPILGMFSASYSSSKVSINQQITLEL